MQTNVVNLVLVIGIIQLCDGSQPRAPTVVANVEPKREVLIKLLRSDPDTGERLYARIRSLPTRGTLYYVSTLFDNYGYEPKRGDAIPAEELTLLLQSKDNAVVYVPPVSEARSPSGAWSTFMYSLSNGLFESNVATAWITPNHRRVAYSHFSDSAEGWKLSNNGASLGAESAVHEAYSRGHLSRYIVGQDGDIRLDRSSQEDSMRWVFSAPPDFLGNHAATYSGELFLTLGSLAGDFTVGRR